MELILNLNQYTYKNFLNSSANIITIGLKNFCSGYETSYPLSRIKTIARQIHQSNKKLYLAINLIMNEEKINALEYLMPTIKELDVEGFVITDWGALELFKENNLMEKVIFNPITTITNKYSANYANSLHLNHVVLANELNLKDLLETINYNKGNVEILAQGYYQIGNSKRHLLTNFFKKFKINNNSKYYYIQEETRDYAYPIIELNKEILIYIDKERCIMPYLDQFKNTDLKYLRIDTIFLSEEEVNLHLQAYANAINNSNSIEASLKLLENTNSNFKCLDNISILKKGS